PDAGSASPRSARVAPSGQRGGGGRGPSPLGFWNARGGPASVPGPRAGPKAAAGLRLGLAGGEVGGSGGAGLAPGGVGGSGGAGLAPGGVGGRPRALGASLALSDAGASGRSGGGDAAAG